MFEKVKEERGLKKLSELGRKLVEETIELPSIEELNECTKELENRFGGRGRINPSYTRNTIIGYKYAETHFNSKGISLLENINNNTKIYLGSYC